MSRRMFVCVALVVIGTLPAAGAFFFGGGNGCACAPPPVCPQAPPPPPCPAAPPVSSCLPQPGCGSIGGSYGGNYANAPSIGSGSYVKQPSYVALPRVSYIGGLQPVSTIVAGPQYSSGPQPVSPVILGYANGPAINTQPPPLVRPAVQVPPASYSAGQEHAAGQRLQEVDDDLNDMIAEAKSEDELHSEMPVNAGGSLSIAEHENIGLTNSTIETKKTIDISQLSITNNTECNSEDLQRILVENMTDDLNLSKRVIQLTAEGKFGGRFDVICSTNDFSYVTNTELYCQETRPHVSCYAYRQL